MYIDWSRIAPVIVSIAVIIVIAIVRQYSQTLVAITVTMPLNIPSPRHVDRLLWLR